MSVVNHFVKGQFIVRKKDKFITTFAGQSVQDVVAAEDLFYWSVRENYSKEDRYVILLNFDLASKLSKASTAAPTEETIEGFQVLQLATTFFAVNISASLFGERNSRLTETGVLRTFFGALLEAKAKDPNRPTNIFIAGFDCWRLTTPEPDIEKFFRFLLVEEARTKDIFILSHTLSLKEPAGSLDFLKLNVTCALSLNGTTDDGGKSQRLTSLVETVVNKTSGKCSRKFFLGVRDLRPEAKPLWNFVAPEESKGENEEEKKLLISLQKNATFSLVRTSQINDQKMENLMPFLQVQKREITPLKADLITLEGEDVDQEQDDDDDLDV